MKVNRFEIYLVRLDPTLGSEMAKTRPCLVVSPDELAHYVRTVVVAPMTTTSKSYPFRVPCTFQGTTGSIALDQLRAVDKSRLGKLLGLLDQPTQQVVLERLAEFFAP
ncbi:MAG: type II toxin-antitoxin system PemK/MazF family toxin [Burkholderiales bacterium]